MCLCVRIHEYILCSNIYNVYAYIYALILTALLYYLCCYRPLRVCHQDACDAPAVRVQGRLSVHSIHISEVYIPYRRVKTCGEISVYMMCILFTN